MVAMQDMKEIYYFVQFLGLVFWSYGITDLEPRDITVGHVIAFIIAPVGLLMWIIVLIGDLVSPTLRRILGKKIFKQN
jgi:hypothetical protein